MIKWPRHYAADYMACNNKAERQAVADSVPAEFKELVKLHIKITKDRINDRKAVERKRSRH